MVIAVLARLDDALFMPQVFRFLMAALVVGSLGAFSTRRLPKISLRLFHAAITVSALAYVLSPILCFYALRILPSSVGALAYVSIPLWFVALAFYNPSTNRRIFERFMVLASIGVVFFGSFDEAALRGDPWTALLLLAVGVVCFMAGSWVSRRLFWLHSALDLNFWAMLFAAGVHFVFALALGEQTQVFEWDRVYWGYLLFLGMVITGLGAHLYRIKSGVLPSLVMTLVVPLGAVGLGIGLWFETPLNVYTVGGALVIIGILVHHSLLNPPSRWMVMYLSNTKRQGDRLLCLLPAEFQWKEEVAKIQITDIAFGGLGFRCQKEIPVGETLMVSIPMGHMNRMLLECKVAHIKQPSKPNREFPWVGGLQFQTVSQSRWQSLIEFLARVANAEEE